MIHSWRKLLPLKSSVTLCDLWYSIEEKCHFWYTLLKKSVTFDLLCEEKCHFWYTLLKKRVTLGYTLLKKMVTFGTLLKKSVIYSILLNKSVTFGTQLKNYYIGNTLFWYTVLHSVIEKYQRCLSLKKSYLWYSVEEKCVLVGLSCVVKLHRIQLKKNIIFFEFHASSRYN